MQPPSDVLSDNVESATTMVTKEPAATHQAMESTDVGWIPQDKILGEIRIPQG